MAVKTPFEGQSACKMCWSDTLLWFDTLLSHHVFVFLLYLICINLNSFYRDLSLFGAYRKCVVKPTNVDW